MCVIIILNIQNMKHVWTDTPIIQNAVFSYMSNMYLH